MVRKDKAGEIKWNELWAQQIFRSQHGGKEYIFALVRRKFGPNDIELKGPGEYIGISQEPIFEMVTDNDPESDTFNERIPKEIITYTGAGKEVKQKVQTGVDWRPSHEATAANLTNYRKLVGTMPKPNGSTKFYWILSENEKYDATNIEDFFNTPLDGVREIISNTRTLKSTAARGRKRALDEQ